MQALKIAQTSQVFHVRILRQLLFIFKLTATIVVSVSDKLFATDVGYIVIYLFST